MSDFEDLNGMSYFEVEYVYFKCYSEKEKTTDENI